MDVSEYEAIIKQLRQEIALLITEREQWSLAYRDCQKMFEHRQKQMDAMRFPQEIADEIRAILDKAYPEIDSDG